MIAINHQTLTKQKKVQLGIQAVLLRIISVNHTNLRWFW